MIHDAAWALVTGREQHSQLKLCVYLQIASCLLPLATANFQAAPFAQIRHGRDREDRLIYCGLAGGWAAQIFSHGLGGRFMMYKRGSFFKKKPQKPQRHLVLIPDILKKPRSRACGAPRLMCFLLLSYRGMSSSRRCCPQHPHERWEERGATKQPMKQPGKTGEQKGQPPKMLGNHERNQLGMEKAERMILPTPCACSFHVGCPALKPGATATDLLVLFCAIAAFTAFWKKKHTIPGGKVFVKRYSRSIVHKRESFQNVLHKPNVPQGLF